MRAPFFPDGPCLRIHPLLSPLRVRAKQAQEEAARAEEEKTTRTFEKSIFRRVLIVFAIFSLIFSLMGFTTGYVLCGLIGLVQTILNVTAWLIGMYIIRTRRRNLPRALFLSPRSTPQTCS